MSATQRECFVVLVLAAIVFLGGTGPARAQQFGPPALISNTTLNSDLGDDVDARVTTDGAGHWVAVWQSYDSLGGTIGTDADILVSRSIDDGATWTPPAPLNTDAASDLGLDTSPQVATDGSGNWVAVWYSYQSLGGTNGSDADILVARSTDNGATWTAPAALNTNASSDGGNDYEPQLTTDGAGNWMAVWWSDDSLGGTIGGDYDILVSRSTNNGATWTAPAALNTNAASDTKADFYPQVSTDGSGNWVAAWTAFGMFGVDPDILVSRSVDNGATWTAPSALNTNAVSDSGEDSSPQISNDGAGNWVAAWWSNDSLGGTIGTDPDILVARSTDNGVTWTAPAALNTNAASDSGDDYAAQVTTDGGGNWIAAWWSNDSLGGTIGIDRDILVARSTDNGATWTAPAALNTNATSDTGNDSPAWLATDSAGRWVAVWSSTDSLGGTTGTDSDILVSRSTDSGATWSALSTLNTNATADTGADYDPQVTTDGAGNWVAVWYSQDSLGGTIGADYDILVSRSSDEGATWTAPAALNTNAASDSGNDFLPQVTTDGAGNWLAVWESYDSLGGTIGTDADILVSRSTNAGATWTAPAALNTNAASDSGNDNAAQVTTDGAGNWIGVWHSTDSLGGTIGTDTDILFSRSTNAGASWSAPAALNTNAASDSGPDNVPQVATDGAGNWVAVWESYDSLGDTIGTDGDIVISRSTNAGATWTAPAALNTNAATDDGDDIRPQVTTDRSGNWVAVWESYDSLAGTIGEDADILVSRSTDSGAAWTALAVLNTNAATDSGDDIRPQVTSDGAGNWIAVWESDNWLGGDSDILVSRSTSGGAVWTAPAALNTNAASDSGNDLAPQVTTDGAGNWAAVWSSDDSLGGTASFGVHDIFVAQGIPVCDPAGPTDASLCYAATKTRLQVSKNANSAKNKLAWQWGGGSAFAQADLGSPLAETRYWLCVWDTTGSIPVLAATILVGPSDTHWSDEDPKGFGYKDKDGSAGGVTRLQLKTGSDGKTSVKFSARGLSLLLPPAAGMTYFTQAPKVVAQLFHSEGNCWSSEFVVGDASRNDETSFKAQTK